MAHMSRSRGSAGAILILCLMSVVSGFLLLHRVGSLRRTAGSTSPRLVSIEPLPAMEGETCQWVPASAGSPWMPLAIQEQQSRTNPAQRSGDAVRADVQKRKPVRVLRDPGMAFAGIAVDPVRDEVVMTDENLFSILVYDRLENTPPRAAMSEPKRMIRGLETQVEFNCGIYVDPASGDIYSPNNDSLHSLVIFDRSAKGNVPPTRKLVTPHSSFGIAVDEQTQEMFVTVQDDHAVVVWKKSASGKDLPVRTLQGSRTLLADPHGIAVDDKRGLLFVANWGTTNERPPYGSQHERYDGGPKEWGVALNDTVTGSGKIFPPSITVYPKGASGDTPPLRVIQGPKTQLNWPTAIAVDSAHGEIFVANDTGDAVAVYQVTANGDAEPVRVIKGPKSLVKNPTGVAYDAKNEELWVSNFGNHTATVYKRTAAGDTPPLRVIRSAPLNAPATMLGNAYNVTYDTKRDEILVAT